MSLRGKILSLFLVLVVFPFVTADVLGYLQSVDGLEKVVELQTSAAADRAAAEVDARVAQLRTELALAANGDDAELPAEDAPPRQARLISASDGADAALRRVTAAAPSLAARFSEVHVLDALGRRRPGAVPSPRVLARVCTRMQDSLVQRVPGGANGAAAGWLIATPLPGTFIPSGAIESGPPQAGFAVLVDRRLGTVVAAARCELVGQRVDRLIGATEAVLAEALRGEERGTRLVRGAGGDHVVAFAGLTELPWTLVRSTALDPYVIPFRQMRVRYTALLLGLAGAGALGFALLVTHYGRSLEDLTLAAERVGQGDFTPWLPIPSRDEVGRLSLAIGGMVQRLGGMMRQIEQSSRLATVGELASYLSHEIRNPLSSLRLNLQEMEREFRTGRLPDDAAETTRVCLGEITRLDSVVRAVLQVGRARTGDAGTCAVHALLEDALALLRPEMERRHITVDAQMTAAEDVIVADGAQLKSVFLNLLINAAEAMAEPGTIRVRTTSVARQGAPAIAVSVVDEGPGIPTHLRERVFEPFFSTKSHGNGIGLTLAQRVVEQAGGTLEFNKRSELERGAEFVVVLPLGAQHAAA